MDKLNWTVISDTLRDTFKTMACCDIKRTQKTKDSVGGDIERSVLMYADVPCYMSKHPKNDVNIDSIDNGVVKDANYTLHFHPDVDVKDGDILVVHDKHGRRECCRQFLVTRVADYFGHTRVETSVWDKLQ